MNDIPEQANLVSILVPCAGLLDYTSLCIPRLLAASRRPFEIICLDLGSMDGTDAYLRAISQIAPVRVAVVRGGDGSLGSAVREALRLAQGGTIAWVNNDVLVCDMWLTQLTGMLHNPRIGMAGPMANIAPPAQRVEEISYRLQRPRAGDGTRGEGLDIGAFDTFAEQYRNSHSRQFADVEQLGAFCFAIKRQVLAKVSLLGDDPDAVMDGGRLSLAVRTAGFALACCKDLYVHHFGVYVVE